MHAHSTRPTACPSAALHTPQHQTRIGRCAPPQLHVQRVGHVAHPATAHRAAPPTLARTPHGCDPAPQAHTHPMGTTPSHAQARLAIPRHMRHMRRMRARTHLMDMTLSPMQMCSTSSSSSSSSMSSSSAGRICGRDSGCTTVKHRNRLHHSLLARECSWCSGRRRCCHRASVRVRVHVWFTHDISTQTQVRVSNGTCGM